MVFGLSSIITNVVLVRKTTSWLALTYFSLLNCEQSQALWSMLVAICTHTIIHIKMLIYTWLIRLQSPRATFFFFSSSFVKIVKKCDLYQNLSSILQVSILPEKKSWELKMEALWILDCYARTRRLNTERVEYRRGNKYGQEARLSSTTMLYSPLDFPIFCGEEEGFSIQLSSDF